MTWGRGGASPARQRGAPGPGVAGTPRPQPRLAPRPRTRAHHRPPAASPSPLRLRLQGKPRPPGLGVRWAASASQGGERAGAEPREPPPSRTRKPHSQAATPGSPATHPSPLLSEGRAQTRPFLVIRACRPRPRLLHPRFTRRPHRLSSGPCCSDLRLRTVRTKAAEDPAAPVHVGPSPYPRSHPYLPHWK